MRDIGTGEDFFALWIPWHGDEPGRCLLHGGHLRTLLIGQPLSCLFRGLYELALPPRSDGLLIALAERMWVQREFRPTMSAVQARRVAEKAERAAYADAVSEYAALGRDELREAARALMSPIWGHG
ncbi:hypothetical protein ACWD9K_36560 [Streptomyces sp. 900116325]